MQFSEKERPARLKTGGPGGSPVDDDRARCHVTKVARHQTGGQSGRAKKVEMVARARSLPALVDAKHFSFRASFFVVTL